MSTHRASILAWSLFAVFMAILLGALGLIAFGSGHADDLFVVPVVGYAIVGALVASRQPGNAIGWLLLAIGIAFALTALVDSHVYAPDPPLFELAAWLSDWSFYAWLSIAAIFLPLLFPNGQLVSRRWRPVFWLGVAAIAFTFIGEAFRPGRLDVDASKPVENPVGIAGAGDALSVLSAIGNALSALAFVLAAASLVVRFRRSRGTERQQLKWFAYVAVLVGAGLMLAMFQVAVGSDGNEVGGFVDALGAVGWFTTLGAVVLGIPVATGFAVLRYRLYDVDVVIKRTLVYGALTATLAGAYLGGVLLLQLVLSPTSDFAIAGSTLAVAAVFRPARGRIQELVNRRFYRRGYDAAQTIEAFSARLRDEVELESVNRELSGVVRETLQPAHVSLWLRAAP